MIEEICKYVFMLTAFVSVLMFLGSLTLFLLTELIPNSLGIEINKKLKKIASEVEHFLTKWACNIGYVFILEYVILGFIFIILKR